tara:strand:+ start:432 stop:743 length:312 start_codon:yes stop_codon:yes gene_type:complete
VQISRDLREICVVIFFNTQMTQENTSCVAKCENVQTVHLLFPTHSMFRKKDKAPGLPDPSTVQSKAELHAFIQIVYGEDLRERLAEVLASYRYSEKGNVARYT